MHRRTRRLATLATAALIAIAASATNRPTTAAAASSLSGSLNDTDSGTTLEFVVHGGQLHSEGPDGLEYRISGTVRPGETVSISASGTPSNWTGRHHVNEDRPATLSVWVDGTDVRDDATIPPGGADSTSVSFVVDDSDRSVRAIAAISSSWINPHGGGSRLLAMYLDLEVVAPPPQATTETTAPARPTQRPDLDCVARDYSPAAAPAAWARYGVRFGDLHGEVNVRPNCEDDDAYVFAELATPLHHDDRIRTRARSGAILSFSDMTTFAMAEDSIIVLDVEAPRESKLALFAGNVWVNLKRLVEDGSFEVEMAQAVAGIKGTTLVASETPEGSAVMVFVGVVELRPTGGDPVTIGPGEKGTATGGAVKVEGFDTDAELTRWSPEVRQMTLDALESANPDQPSSTNPLPWLAGVVAIAAGMLLWSRRRGADRLT